MSLGDRLKRARKATGLNQTEFGRACGVSLNGQSNFERDDNIPGGAYLQAAANLGVDVNYVLTGRAGARDEAESELLMRFRSASLDVQAAVLRSLGVAVAGKQLPTVSIAGGNQGQVVAGNVSQDSVTINVGGKKRGARK
ncbi:MAG: helix-turn-helix transcriptional regulator [Xanthomonadales bacterium]|nr:helix-turn-helix transcriptional regulator [Xanthomonadales bacterium]